VEVVIKASLASTQEMEIEEDLKKQGQTTPNMTSTMDTDKKESPEQKRIQNTEKQMENTTVWALFIGIEEMTFEEEEKDDQADLTKKVKTTDTQKRKQETRNHKHKPAMRRNNK